MRFLKQHYEKIILSVVLLGLIGAAVWLLQALGQAGDKLQSASANPPPPKAYRGADLTNALQGLANLKAPPALVLAGEHNLFNPVTWKKKFDGTIFKISSGREEGPDALVIEKLTPLRFTISFGRAAGTGFYVDVAKENGASEAERRKRPFYISQTGDMRNQFFQVKSITGSGDDVKIAIEVLDSKEFATITPQKPYERIDSYSVDLRYDLEQNKEWKDQRVGKVIYFYGDAYKIVYIDKNEVRVMANSNSKQTTIKWNAAR
jgi:hypothetical protein